MFLSETGPFESLQDLWTALSGPWKAPHRPSFGAWLGLETRPEGPWWWVAAGAMGSLRATDGECWKMRR